jgi:hypothetical protein
MGGGASVPTKNQMPYVLPPEDPEIFTILLVARPGVGKSLLSNFFIDGNDSGRFQSGITGNQGLTTEVKSA